MAIFTSAMAVNPRGIRANTATQECDLGSKVESPNGDIYRYVKVGGTTLVPGKLYDGPANIGNHTNIAVASAAAIGAFSVTVTLGATAATANQYQGGQLVVNDVTGEGHTYTIKSHPAADASASLVVTLTDDEPILVALTTSSEVSLVPNQYNGIIIHATTETGIPVGVAVTPVTNAQYGWIKTRGAVSVLCNATTTLGDSVAASDTTNAGGVEVGDGILPPVGYALAAGVATEYNPVFLNID